MEKYKKKMSLTEGLRGSMNRKVQEKDVLTGKYDWKSIRKSCLNRGFTWQYGSMKGKVSEKKFLTGLQGSMNLKVSGKEVLTEGQSFIRVPTVSVLSSPSLSLPYGS